MSFAISINLSRSWKAMLMFWSVCFCFSAKLRSIPPIPVRSVLAGAVAVVAVEVPAAATLGSAVVTVHTRADIVAFSESTKVWLTPLRPEILTKWAVLLSIGPGALSAETSANRRIILFFFPNSIELASSSSIEVTYNSRSANTFSPRASSPLRPQSNLCEVNISSPSS
uniref:Putative secreted peptide n=1 Tax=Anopheles braziliensis TaxID=58242 RepID=A0A2M3ZTC4_9DIPT